MTDHQERILVVNCYGNVVEGATASYRDERSVRVTAPGHIDRIVFITRRTKRVMLVIDPKTAKGPGLKDACEMNLIAVCGTTYVHGAPLSQWLTMLVLRKQDRCYYNLGSRITENIGGGQNLAMYLDRTDAWRSVSPRLHKAHKEGFAIVGSWKTNRKAPDLQVTLWRQDTHDYASLRTATSAEWSYVAELDIDLRSGKGHIFEVARNKLTGSTTNPYLVNQALSYRWGVISFRLEPTP